MISIYIIMTQPHPLFSKQLSSDRVSTAQTRILLWSGLHMLMGQLFTSCSGLLPLKFKCCISVVVFWRVSGTIFQWSECISDEFAVKWLFVSLCWVKGRWCPWLRESLTVLPQGIHHFVNVFNVLHQATQEMGRGTGEENSQTCSKCQNLTLKCTHSLYSQAQLFLSSFRGFRTSLARPVESAE